MPHTGSFAATDSLSSDCFRGCIFLIRSKAPVVGLAEDDINTRPALSQARPKSDSLFGEAGSPHFLGRVEPGDIEENLAFASIFSVLGVPIATVVFYPFFGIPLSPMIAAAAMNFSLVSVI